MKDKIVKITEEQEQWVKEHLGLRDFSPLMRGLLQKYIEEVKE